MLLCRNSRGGTLEEDRISSLDIPAAGLRLSFMLWDFELAGRRVRLWQRAGESFEHVLMKALGYAMFVNEFPSLEIEQAVGLRYKPDLVARKEESNLVDGVRGFAFWGECGMVSTRKVAWLLKHAGVERLVIFKIEAGANQFAHELRQTIDKRYLVTQRLQIVNFVGDIREKTVHRKIARVPPNWYALTQV